MGGLGGHLRHLFEDLTLSFGDLKEVFSLATQGKLEKVSEKTDGQNIFISWDPVSGEMRAARNKTNVKSGGMSISDISKKFQGRDGIHDAFVKGMIAIEKAAKRIGPNALREIFIDEDGSQLWYGAEIIYTNNPNVINYTGNHVVFHEVEKSPVFRSDFEEVQKDESSRRFSKFVNILDNIQDQAGEENWRVRGPAVIELNPLDSTAETQAVAELDSFMAKYGLSDNSTIKDYMFKVLTGVIETHTVLRGQKKNEMVKRLLVKAGTSIRDITKGLTREEAAKVKELDANRTNILRAAVRPIESIIYDFSLHIMTSFKPIFINNPSQEIQRIKEELDDVIKTMKSDTSEESLAVLSRELERLKGIDKLVSPTEGIVFMFKDKAFKLTGPFAPLNQLLGFFKYKRKVTENYKVLRSIISEIVANTR